MISVFRDQHMRQESWASQAARNRPRGGVGLNDLVAASAGELGPDMPDNLEARRDVLEHLGNIFAESLHCPTTRRAGAALFAWRLVDHVLARQVRGQWPPGALLARGDRLHGQGRC